MARAEPEAVQLAPDRAHGMKERQPVGVCACCLCLTPELEAKELSGGHANMPFFRHGSTPLAGSSAPTPRTARVATASEA